MHTTTVVADSEVVIEGSGEHTLVMVHGWPDTRELWRQQIAFFRERYRCVSFTLPGFSPGERSDYSLNETVQRISDIVDAVSPDKPVILLLHDWGCVFGYEYAMRHSHRVEKMIGLDVGDIDSPALQKSLSIPAKLMIFIYQMVLAISFVCPRFIGDPIARFTARALRARSKMEYVHAGMSMPYAMRWFGINGGLGNLLPVEPTFPFYYAYATQKPMMFQSPEWLQWLSKQPGNRVQAYDCGHWIMVDCCEELNASIADWLLAQT